MRRLLMCKTVSLPFYVIPKVRAAILVKMELVISLYSDQKRAVQLKAF